MIKKIDHVVLTTKNITRCREFYLALGFCEKAESNRYEFYAGDFKINVHILGNELYPHAGMVQPGSADLCFEIEGDLRDVLNRIQDQGIEIEVGIVERMGVRGKMESIYMRDPDDNLVECCSYG
ncbi:MAG: VOC family protein [Eubacteriales bacterium]